MATKKIAITDYVFDNLDIERGVLEPNGCSLISQRSGKDPAALAGLVSDADAVITQFAPVDAAIVGAMRKARVIVRYGIGVDNVDLQAAAAKGIPVCNVPDYCTDEVADHTLAMILELTRRICSNALKVRAGVWGMGVPFEAMHALKDMTVGVVALGRIGREVVSRLKPFKCRILVFDPVVPAAAVRAAGCEPATLDELLAGSDLITLHCPSTEQTKRMINARSIARMKPGAMLVNASRGTLVNTDDLVAALRAGHIAAAALDVADPEPLPAGHPLVAMDNVLINAHIASVSPQAVKKLRTDAASTALAAVRGQKLSNVVNGVV
ncbi:MAG: C-terminal binding protein [Kiritimatiellae bacterium]|nr:C-terminal binding protein [Kiritimatiellia bacterium]